MRNVISAVLVFSTFSMFCSERMAAECYLLTSINCEHAPTNHDPCFNTPCVPHQIFPELLVCPFGTQGCKHMENEHYDGFTLGEGPFGGFNLGAQAICVRCGDCNGCGLVSLRCMEDDPENWAPQETYYHLIGVGVCN